MTNAAMDADDPANTLSFSLVSAPLGVALDPATGVLVWTPMEAQGPSTNIIAIQVMDDGVPALSDTRSITVLVGEVNHPPVLSPIGKITANEETSVDFTISSTDPDIPAQTLRYALDTAPLGAMLDPSRADSAGHPPKPKGPSPTC